MWFMRMAKGNAVQNAIAVRNILLVGLPLCLLFALFFGEIIFAGKLYDGGDIARIYLPQRVELKRTLVQRELPWWTPYGGAGYPLLAEGETGALYPLNWPLYIWLPPEIGLTVSIVLHYLIGWLGFYAFGRWLRLSRAAAFLGSTVWTFGGFQVAHLSHVSIITASAWLSWMFALTHRLLGDSTTRRWSYAAGLALVVGLQFLGGHAQVSLLGLLALGALAVYRARAASGGLAWRRLGLWILSLSIGALLAFPQLWASFELGQLSQRGGGLTDDFFTSYSFHPLLLLTYLSPFVLGNPYPQGSVEIMGYVGLFPLILGLFAIRRSGKRYCLFFLGLAIAGLVFSLGRWNPLYRFLRHVPILNLFRVPARYLYWTSFGLAVLAALGVDAVKGASRLDDGRRASWGVSLGLLGAAALLIIVLREREVKTLVASWRWLPLVIGAVTLPVMYAARRVDARWWILACCALICADLYAYGAVLDTTYNASAPRYQVLPPLVSTAFLEQDDALYRVYTKEEIVPALSVMRESLYPNIALSYGVASANLYLPLVPQNYLDYLASMTPERLNRLNVKYYLIPQLLPVDEETELYDVENPFAALPTNTWLPIAPQTITGLEIESFLSHAANIPDGQLVAELLLRTDEGQTVAVALRAGLDTAEWAYERDDVRRQIAHAMPQVATSWSARSGFPPRDHIGHTYFTLREWPSPLRVVAVMVRPLLPPAFVRVERVRLWGDQKGGAKLLNHLVGLGDHSIVYRSEDVLIYRNEDVLPRAYALKAHQVAWGQKGLRLPQHLAPDEIIAVEMLRYGVTEVELCTIMPEAGYLILADLYYPGWHVTVDDIPARILPVDGVFRGVALERGSRHVRFYYRPTWVPERLASRG